MADGRTMEGLFVMGQNPPSARPTRDSSARRSPSLKWLVVRDMVETETASFWYDSPEIERGELAPERIATEVFLFPAAAFMPKKMARFTNTQRLLQWRDKPSIRPGTRAATRGSSTTWAGG